RETEGRGGHLDLGSIGEVPAVDEHERARRGPQCQHPHSRARAREIRRLARPRCRRALEDQGAGDSAVKWMLAAVLVPAVYWPHGFNRATDMKAAGIERVAVPPDQADAWRRLGFTVEPTTEADLSSRQALIAPGILSRPAMASATRSPWTSANGWRVL